jgi:UDP-N-acetylglucosamine/UDP-N-acetylgalactosamine diphosphorylase
MIPALDLEGRILLAEKGSLFLAPNGHGGTLAALQSAGLLQRARDKGIQTLSYFQVDNPLVRPADTLFLGLHAEQQARMSSKVVAKRVAGEKVGVIGKVNGVLGCIEYSDLPAVSREARDPKGRLMFDAGNIAAHLIQVDFVEELTRDSLELPWHVARKRMKVTGPDGNPAEVDGAKFETFVFDALGQSPSSVTLEVERKLEFSPVKNAVGEDSPLTARKAMCELYSDWLRAADHELPPADVDGIFPVEIDPLVAEDLQGFLARSGAGPQRRDAGLLYDPA